VQNDLQAITRGIHPVEARQIPLLLSEMRLSEMRLKMMTTRGLIAMMPTTMRQSVHYVATRVERCVVQMDSIIFFQPSFMRSTPPRDGFLRSDSACISKSASEISQRNELKDILSNVLNDHDLIEVRGHYSSGLWRVRSLSTSCIQRRWKRLCELWWQRQRPGFSLRWGDSPERDLEQRILKSWGYI